MIQMLRPDMVKRLQQLAVSPFRPQEILALQEWIDGEKRALAVREAVLGMNDEELLKRAALVVQAMRRLDALYVAWAEEELV